MYISVTKNSSLKKIVKRSRLVTGIKWNIGAQYSYNRINK